MNLLSVDTPVDPTITGLNSNNVLEIEDPVTSANLPSGRNFYDLELITGDTVTRLIEGRFQARENVTR